MVSGFEVTRKTGVAAALVGLLGAMLATNAHAVAEEELVRAAFNGSTILVRNGN